MDDPLAALRARFLQRSRADLDLLRASPLDRSAIAAVVHRLSGAAGMFGFPEVSRLAARVDDQIQAGEPVDEVAMRELVTGLEALPKSS